MKRLSILIAGMLVAVSAGGAGYWLGQSRSAAEHVDIVAAAVPSPSTSTAHAAPDRVPIYYQDPDGKPDYSATPKKGTDGREFVPVYEDASGVATPASSDKPPAAAQATSRAESEQRKILYYRNPMGLSDTSPVPKKDSMGMDYAPVYADEGDASDPPGTVRISPGKVQTLGVRTAAVEERPALSRMVRATGTVQLDERHLAVVTTKVEGWIERLAVSATGEAVHRGQILAEIYSPELVAAEQEYLLAVSMADAAHRAPADMSHGDPAALIDATTRRLRALDVPDDEIARLKKSRTAGRRIAIHAPADGVVIEKAAVEGMRFTAGEPLFKTADLSTVWLIAEIQEQDLGAVRPGEEASASFVAFAGRSFKGTVDFVYPMLSRETRTARVRIIVPNRNLDLRGDMYASVTIEAPSVASNVMVLAVPDSAVIDGGAKKVVLIVRGEGRYEPREVSLGAHGEGWTQIVDGVKAGDQVVVGANFLIDAESNLRAALQTFTPPAGGQK